MRYIPWITYCSLRMVLLLESLISLNVFVNSMDDAAVFHLASLPIEGVGEGVQTVQ